MKYNSYSFVFFMSLLFLTSFTVGLDSLGTFDIGQDITLLQTCSDCSYITLSKVYFFDDNLTILQNQNMTLSDTLYSYTILADNFTRTGRYIVLGYSDDGTFSYDFYLKPNKNFYVDLSDPLTIIFLIGFFILSIIIFFRTRFSWVGAFFIFIEGFILLINRFNPLLSFFIIAMGVFLLINDK